MKAHASLLTAVFFSTVVVSTGGFAQILTYDLNAATGNQASQSANFVAPGLVAGSLTRGSGVTASALADSISSSGWSTSTIDLSDYYTLSLSASAGYSFNLDKLYFRERRSSTGITSFEIRTSLDGFSSSVGGTPLSVPDDTSNRDHAISLATLTGLTAIEIRIYGYGAEASGGTWALKNNLSEDYVGLTGTVIPEPATYAAILGVISLGVVAWRRRRRSAG